MSDDVMFNLNSAQNTRLSFVKSYVRTNCRRHHFEFMSCRSSKPIQCLVPCSLKYRASALNMEPIIVSNMMDYFDTHNILCPQQNGFRSKHNCETQLIGFTQEIADSLDQGQQTDVIAMDFSKAFDKVDYHKLVHKLKHMGVNPCITTWIKDFLHNRSQQVLVENKVSHSLPVLSGAPQGSVVGLSLFLAYINDLQGSVRSRVRLFADDTIAHLTIKSHASAQSLQEDTI